MVDQLFRQEAVDGYTERWLGEVSELPAIPQLPLALLGVVMLTSLVAILTFGSYRRQTMCSGVITGSHEQVLVISVSAISLHVGEDLPLEVQAGRAAGGPFTARVAWVAPSASGRSVCRVGVEIPAALRKEAGVHFLLRGPLERRRIYQRMLSCFSN
jgi:hypothetical protein